jgi:hypothetical protein
MLFRYGVGVGGLYDYLFSIHNSFPNHTLWITEYADTELNSTGSSRFFLLKLSISQNAPQMS